MGQNSKGPAAERVTLMIGGDLADDAAAFVDAWHRAELGDVVPERVVAFETWDGLAGAVAMNPRKHGG